MSRKETYKKMSNERICELALIGFAVALLAFVVLAVQPVKFSLEGKVADINIPALNSKLGEASGKINIEMPSYMVWDVIYKADNINAYQYQNLNPFNR